MAWDRMFEAFSTDLGIDLGTCSTLVHARGKGIVLCEPSVVAMERGTKKVVAVGTEAKKMLWKTPGDIVALRPIRDGVIADFEATEKMIRYFIEKVISRRWFVKPRMVIGVPTCITEVEKRAVRDSAEQAGARDVYLIQESMAAAIGANIPILEPAGHMICDIGGGTTEISVISLGGMVVTNAIRVGGDEFDEAIIKHVRNVHNLIIGESTAENVKITIGNASPDKKIEKIEIKGTDAITGLPRKLEMDSVEVREALQEPINTVIEEIKKTLGQTPPELAADIVERGIVMTGGGSLLKGFPKLIAKETGVPVILAENPLLCVALGAGKFLESQREDLIPCPACSRVSFHGTGGAPPSRSSSSFRSSASWWRTTTSSSSPRRSGFRLPGSFRRGLPDFSTGSGTPSVPSGVSRPPGRSSPTPDRACRTWTASRGRSWSCVARTRR
jgi:rod shape-determining protein MreB and related proteins